MSGVFENLIVAGISLFLVVLGLVEWSRLLKPDRKRLARRLNGHWRFARHRLSIQPSLAHRVC